MSANPVRRVFFVSYLFPPAGGVGVHRVVKFVKYLPEFGWESTVLTVSNPSVPLIDESLQKDIPTNTTIVRARTLEPGYALKGKVSASASSGKTASWSQRCKSFLRRSATTVLQPDAQILWHHHAFREGMKALRERAHDVIVATAPPFSSLLLGARLARASGVPLVLDYRDEWDISNAYWENRRAGKIQNSVQQWMQRKVLRAARCVIATTPSSTAAIEEIGRHAGGTAEFRCIYNGFDPSDFDQQAGTRPEYGNGPNLFRISFVGTLWNLNSIEPFVQGVKKLVVDHPDLAGNLEIVCAGRKTTDQESLLDSLVGTPCKIVKLPFVEHDQATQLMQSTDALLLLNADFPHTHRIIPAKTFEYIATRRPIFVVAPRGDLWDVFSEIPGTTLCEPRDPTNITRSLAECIRTHQQGKRPDLSNTDLSRFHRRHSAEELAMILDQFVAGLATTARTPHAPLPHDELVPATSP